MHHGRLTTHACTLDTQLVGAGLRVSCANRILAPALGAIGVGAASALSGHMSRHLKRQREAGKDLVQSLLAPFWDGFDVDAAIVDAFTGMVFFKVAAERRESGHRELPALFPLGTHPRRPAAPAVAGFRGPVPPPAAQRPARARGLRQAVGPRRGGRACQRVAEGTAHLDLQEGRMPSLRSVRGEDAP